MSTLDNNNVIDFYSKKTVELKAALDSLPEQKGSGGGSFSGGGMDDLVKRVERLDSDVAAVKTDIAVIKSNYATTAHVASAEATLVKWIVGVGVGIVALVFAGLNYMKPGAQPPLVIQVPQSSTGAPAQAVPPGVSVPEPVQPSKP